MPRILKNIDDRFNRIAQARKAKAAGKTVATDTLGAVTELLGKNFENVPVGGGMAFPVPAGESAKGYLAKVRGRLVAVARLGQPWAGRRFQSGIDAIGDRAEILVKRLADGDPYPAKRGGRPEGSKNKPKGGEPASEAPVAATDGDKANGASTESTEDQPKRGPGGRFLPKTQVKDLTANAQKAAA